METSPDTIYIVADTSGLYSLLSETDSNHTPALLAAEQFHRQGALLLLPYDIFAETINTIGKKHGHRHALEVADYLMGPAFIRFDSSDREREGALARFRETPQTVSYTDCIVMAVADDYGTRQIFGFDEGFAREGYDIIDKEALSPAA